MYINAGATLTILPGVEVRIKSADKSDPYNFMYNNGVPPTVKMIKVNGKIIAKGTKEQPIIFDKIEEHPDYRWGSIAMTTNAPKSEFEYCVIKHSAFIEDSNGELFNAALIFNNGRISIRNCYFLNNMCGIKSLRMSDNLLIYNCVFQVDNALYPASSSKFIKIDDDTSNPTEHDITIAKCRFNGPGRFEVTPDYSNQFWLNNQFYNNRNYPSQRDNDRNLYGNISYYGNRYLDGVFELTPYSGSENDTVFCRRNILEKNETVNILGLISSSGIGTNIISDNLMIGDIALTLRDSENSHAFAYNNIIKFRQYPLKFYGPYDDFSVNPCHFFNNLLVRMNSSNYGDISSTECYSVAKIFNNTYVNFRYLLRGSDNSTVLTNNIFDNYTEFIGGSLNDDALPQLSYNCMELPIPNVYNYLDAGNNIVADPLFLGIDNYDFQLSVNSPCIDTGLNIPELPAFDLNYHKRIVAGHPENEAIVDRGAYEYNSVYIGGISAIVYDSYTGMPVDCVKASIYGRLPEYSDSLGAFLFNCGAGEYSITLSRWDYYDQTVSGVVVNEGSNTILMIYLDPINPISTDDMTLPVQKPLLLNNYPNPFNPSTRICLNVPKDGKVSLSIYNIKGQKVKTLLNETLSKGSHEVIWNGTDQHGHTVSSGVYFARIEQQGNASVRKMLMMK